MWWTTAFSIKDFPVYLDVKSLAFGRGFFYGKSKDPSP